MDEMPEIPLHLQWIWSGFTTLSAGRPRGLGPQPISQAELLAYLRLHDIVEGNLVREFMPMIEALDRTWLDYAEEKARQK